MKQTAEIVPFPTRPVTEGVNDQVAARFWGHCIGNDVKASEEEYENWRTTQISFGVLGVPTWEKVCGPLQRIRLTYVRAGVGV